MPPRQRVQAESREVQDGVDGVVCRVTKYEKRTLVQVGTEAALSLIHISEPRDS